jgi:hypothetical protein
MNYLVPAIQVQCRIGLPAPIRNYVRIMENFVKGGLDGYGTITNCMQISTDAYNPEYSGLLCLLS